MEGSFAAGREEKPKIRTRRGSEKKKQVFNNWKNEMERTKRDMRKGIEKKAQ